MADPSGRAIVERFARAIEDKDFEAQAALLADDYVELMPRSGERVRGKANAIAIARNYPGGVGTVTSDRLVGAEDKWVLTPSRSASCASRAPATSIRMSARLATPVVRPGSSS